VRAAHAHVAAISPITASWRFSAFISVAGVHETTVGFCECGYIRVLVGVGGGRTRREEGQAVCGALSLPPGDGMAPVAAGSWYLMRCADVGALGAVSVAPAERH
jgi:hypothetical protein